MLGETFGRRVRQFHLRPVAGGVCIINPGEFAAYTFTLVGAVVAGISALTLVKKISGGRGHRAVGAGGTDPGQESIVQLAAELEALRDEVAGQRRELEEAHNRLDFTERLLAQARERGLLSAPKER